MHIDTLSLEQFRSFPALQLDFSADADTHVFVGNNGAGKTNILEAISALSIGKSFLSADEADMIRWKTDYFRVKATLSGDHGERKMLEVVSQVKPRKQKAFFVNDVRNPFAAFVGHLPTVTFLPQDLELFTGSPALRRGFLDQLLVQVSPEFAKTTVQYQKIIKQRNAALKKIAQGFSKSHDLQTWDTMLASTGAAITLKRLELIEVLQCTLGEELCSLGEQWSDALLVYERKGKEREEEAIAEELKELLLHYQERDMILQSTTIGPHRDDWRLDVTNHAIETFASRGQQRTAVLALLFLKVSFLELRRGEKPVVLLDDVFSELDDAHQQALLQSLHGHQVLITTTHVPDDLHGAVLWEVEEGSIKMQITSSK